MATIAIKILKHQKKADGTFNVKIRVTHKDGKRYIDTPHFVSERQLTPGFTLKDAFLIKQLNAVIDDYRLTISKLDDKLHLFTAETLRDYLKGKDEEIDFLKFCKIYIDDLYESKRDGSAKTLNTVRLALIDFFEREHISPMEINDHMLISFDKFLRSERLIIRLNQGKMRTRKIKGLSDGGVHNRMRDLRILFKAAMRLYNNPQTGDIRIPYCPFDKYKIVEVPETKKRNITVPQLIQIRDCKVTPGGRMELARDLFMLSFYLCGTNAIDLYYLLEENIVNGRVEYNRSKTENRRKDGAFISIKIIREAKPVLDQYIGKLSLRYSSSENLDRAINEGMKLLCKYLKIPFITFYWARHSFGNLARNKCRMSKDDVAQALNHLDNEHKTTDIYLAKDWDIVDDVQKAVINLLRSHSQINEHVLPKLKVKMILQSLSLNSLISD